MYQLANHIASMTRDRELTIEGRPLAFLRHSDFMVQFEKSLLEPDRNKYTIALTCLQSLKSSHESHRFGQVGTLRECAAGVCSCTMPTR